jgi:hypothetical protein
MTNIAYLIGVNGSGKGYIAKQLEEDLQVLTVDWLHHKAADRLSPEDNRPWYNWERWDDHLGALDVVTTFTELFAELWPNLSNARPILAEALILGHHRWRQAFRKALVRRGIEIGDERIFWIHPSAKELLKFRQQRGRPDQQAETLEVVTQHRNWFNDRANSDWGSPYEDAEATVRDIRQYLLS